MQAVDLVEIVKSIGGILILGDPHSKVGGREKSKTKWPPPGISIDSRTIEKNDIFIAVKGPRYNGHQFINDAVLKGAAVCIVSEIPQDLDVRLTDYPSIIQVEDTKKALLEFARYYRKKFASNIEMVTINGSCGKTTAKEMTAQILSRFSSTSYSPGNYNNEIGCPLSMFLLSPQNHYGVFEIGSSSRGEVERLAEMIHPKIAIITNIHLEHTETFGTLQDIAQGEAEILSQILPQGTAILPADDPHYEFLKQKVPKDIHVVSFGFSERASVQIGDLSYANHTTIFNLIHKEKNEKIKCTLPVLGRFNALNACAAGAACMALNVPIKTIQSGFTNFIPPQMRFQTIQIREGATIINDTYNSNPGSARSSMESFIDSFPNIHKIVVLGDMLELGNISNQEHYALGEFVAGLPIHSLVLYGKESLLIRDGFKKKCADGIPVVHCTSFDEVLVQIKPWVQTHCAILFKGSRGMKLETIVHKLTT